MLILKAPHIIEVLFFAPIGGFLYRQEILPSINTKEILLQEVYIFTYYLYKCPNKVEPMLYILNLISRNLNDRDICLQ